MAKRKKNRSQTAIASQSFDILEEVLSCNDGAALASKHLALGVEALHAVATLLFAALFVESIEEPGTYLPPSKEVLDYLERAARLLGLQEVADHIQTDIKTAMLAFSNAPVDLDRSVKNNAKAMDLLLS